MEIDEEWATGRKYLTRDEYEACKKSQQASTESPQPCAATASVIVAPFTEEGNLHTTLDLTFGACKGILGEMCPPQMTAMVMH
jgi:hypothetical protein